MAEEKDVTPEPTLRDSIASAFDADTAGTSGDADTGTDTLAPDAARELAETDEKLAATDKPEKPVSEESKAGPAGKQAAAKEPLKGAKQPPKADAKPSGDAEKAPPSKEEPKKLRAPGSWKPALREKWEALPADVQQEIHRREREIAKGMTETQDSRSFQQEFQNTVAPFANIIAAEGGEPLAVVKNLMTTAATLSHGTPMQKAQTVAAIIANFGIDIQTLDSLLAGNQQAAQGHAANVGGGTATAEQYIQQAVQRALAPLLQQGEARMAQQREEVDQSIEDFANDPKNEFFEDVRETMADILDMAARRGQKINLQTAYNRAILMHDDISAVVQERQLKEKAAAASAVAAAARKKAVSVTGAPAIGSQASSGGNLRSDIENAIGQLEQ